MISTTELFSAMSVVMAIGYAALWLAIAALGLWRVRVALVPGALLIASGLFGATLTFLTPIVHMVVSARASLASVDAMMTSTITASIILSFFGTIPWLLLLVALWRLLLDLPRAPEDP